MSLQTKSTTESGGDNAVMYGEDGLPIYGMDVQLQKKLKAKRDPERESEIQEWIETLTGEKYSHDGNMQESLKNGQLLCKLVNAIQPGTVKKISTAKMAFMQMNNINAFLGACKKFGVKKTDLFVTVDLYEGKNIPAVVEAIFSLGSICKGLKGYDGPTIGTKRSKATKYEFTQEQLNQAKNSGTLLSFGGKGCASQAGTRSIGNEVVKSKSQGIRGAVSKLNEGGKGCSSQAGTRSNSNEVVKVSKDSKTTKKQKEPKVQEEVQEEVPEVQEEVQEEVPEVQEELPEEVPEELEEVVEEDDDDEDESEDTSLEELEKLAAQRDAGEITEEAFSARKKEILGL